jgi:excisionase family DNA binding protein
MAEEKRYLRAAEVAELFHVSPKTVTRWAVEKQIPSVKTLGGHRRFPASRMRELAGRMAAEGLELSL